ncbi:MAG TPA: DUF4433 domain-containing protein [Chthonomonadaceae bacterium]|nr:DUF4433 domain-containing protein [Chthonomonadaceae bacterium]
MKREELTELHFITPSANLPTILRFGIQSHRRVEVGRKKGILQPVSIAMQEVQDIREGVRVPGGLALHEYVNLYICARNPMLFKRQDQHLEICVLRVDTAVLDIAGAVVTDMNAAKGIARFAPAPEGLEIVNREMVFAEDWRHPGDPVAYERHRAIKCAEVLIPDQVTSVYIKGAYVSCQEALARVKAIAQTLQVTIDSHLFFREVSR